jgi:hypothetical protein
MNKNHRLNAILVIGLALGFGFTISVVSAAPPITVTSAVPDEAEQGTTNLTVIINGRGFDPVMGVKFCRSGTNEDCVPDPGDIVVKGSVEFINAKQLRVTVDIGANAVIDNFDIEVESFSSPGRRGRGIEKFAVLKAGSGKEAEYSVMISGPVAGYSTEPWRKIRTQGIGYTEPQPDAGTFTNLTFFFDKFAQGSVCFGMANRMWSGGIRLIKHGNARANFWLVGETQLGGDPVIYILSMTGNFDDTDNWLPSVSTFMIMTDWEMKVDNSQYNVGNFACKGKGKFDGTDGPVRIDVARTN